MKSSISISSPAPISPDPASPNIAGYDPADGAKLAWMAGARTSTRGERGPWSAAVSETIRG